jgi:hypothetical protein
VIRNQTLKPVNQPAQHKQSDGDHHQRPANHFQQIGKTWAFVGLGRFLGKAFTGNIKRITRTSHRHQNNC